jgi:hypothetical protein
MTRSSCSVLLNYELRVAVPPARQGRSAEIGGKDMGQRVVLCTVRKLYVPENPSFSLDSGLDTLDYSNYILRSTGTYIE